MLHLPLDLCFLLSTFKACGITKDLHHPNNKLFMPLESGKSICRHKSHKKTITRFIPKYDRKPVYQSTTEWVDIIIDSCLIWLKICIIFLFLLNIFIDFSYCSFVFNIPFKPPFNQKWIKFIIIPFELHWTKVHISIEYAE